MNSLMGKETIKKGKMIEYTSENWELGSGFCVSWSAKIRIKVSTGFFFTERGKVSYELDKNKCMLFIQCKSFE